MAITSGAPEPSAKAVMSGKAPQLIVSVVVSSMTPIHPLEKPSTPQSRVTPYPPEAKDLSSPAP